MTENKYKILDLKNGQYVEIITANGEVVNSPFGKIFPTYGHALSYLYECQKISINNQRFFRLDRFQVEELKLMRIGSLTVNETIQGEIMSDPDSDEKIGWLKSILKQSVLDGFNTMQSDFLNFVLTYDKYEPIMSEIVPPHIIQCIDEFKTVGILSCDLDLFGSVSLTASEKQHKMFDIDGLFKRRTEKASK